MDGERADPTQTATMNKNDPPIPVIKQRDIQLRDLYVRHNSPTIIIIFEIIYPTRQLKGWYCNN